MCIYVMINFSERLKTHTSDSNEDKVQRLLQRLGMRKTVDIYFENIVTLFCYPFAIILCHIAQYYVLKTTSFWFIFWNVFIYAANTFSLNHLVRFAIDNHFWAEFVEQGLELLGISVVIQSYLLPVINPNFVYVSSFLLPLPAINWIVKLGIIASNRGIDVMMLQPNVIVAGNDMTEVMRISAYSLIFKLVLMLWFYPFKVYNDEKGSRGPLYCFKRSFWQDVCRCCGGRHQNVASDDNFQAGGDQQSVG